MRKTRYPTIDKVDCRYGAPMGRPAWPGEPEKGTVTVFRVPMGPDAGYDRGGAYWGIGETLWCATDGTLFRRFTRAWGRTEALLNMGVTYPMLKRGDGDKNP
jgi:hypothetical protein